MKKAKPLLFKFSRFVFDHQCLDELLRTNPLSIYRKRRNILLTLFVETEEMAEVLQNTPQTPFLLISFCPILNRRYDVYDKNMSMHCFTVTIATVSTRRLSF